MTRILVVDDETQLRRALGITLKAHGYDIIAAASGTHADRQSLRPAITS